MANIKIFAKLRCVKFGINQAFAFQISAAFVDISWHATILRHLAFTSTHREMVLPGDNPFYLICKYFGLATLR